MVTSTTTGKCQSKVDQFSGFFFHLLYIRLFGYVSLQTDADWVVDEVGCGWLSAVTFSI